MPDESSPQPYDEAQLGSGESVSEGISPRNPVRYDFEWRRAVDGSLIAHEIRFGTAGTPVTIGPSGATTGFTFDPAHPGNIPSDSIAANGSTVLRRFYTSNTDTPYRFEHRRSSDGSLLASEDRIGTSWVMASIPLGTFPGYTFDPGHLNNFLNERISGNGLLVLRCYYTANTNTPYRFEWRRANGSLINEEIRTGTTGALITIGPGGFSGYAFDAANPGNVLTGNIVGDGTAVLVRFYSSVTPVSFAGVNANGASGTITTTQLTLDFDVNPVNLAANDITVSGGVTVTGISGTGTTRIVYISGSWVDGASVDVSVASPTGFSMTGGPHPVVLHRAPTGGGGGDSGSGGWTPTPSPRPSPSPAPTPTPWPSPSPAPSPSPTPTPVPALPSVRVEVSQGLKTELQTLIGFSDIDINIETSAPDTIGGFVTADISFSVDNANLNRILNDELPSLLQMPGVYYTVFADLSGFITAGVNYHRIVALYDGAIIGGGISNQDAWASSSRSERPARDMIFSVNTSNMGEFTISYVANLRRLVLSLDSFTIRDLAGNAPTQTMDIRPVIQNNRVLIPLRFIAEALGAEVDWTSATADRPLTVHITLNGQTLSFGIGELTPQLAALGLDVPAQLMDNRTMVPLRFVAEFFGAVVSWDGDTSGIEIIWSSDMEAYFDR